MIAVRERAERFGTETHRPRTEQPATRPFRERQVRLPLTALLVAAFVLAAAFGYVNALAVTVGYRAEALRLELAELERERQSLSARIDKLDSLSRVELVAVNHLGMVRPTPDDVLYVALAPTPVADPSPAAREASVAADGTAAGRNGGSRELADARETGLFRAFLDFVAR